MHGGQLLADRTLDQVHKALSRATFCGYSHSASFYPANFMYSWTKAA